MNPLYNSRQRKIYNDYNSWSAEKLMDILKNRDNYNPDIIGVIAEILKERNITLPGSFTPSSDIFVKEKPVSEKEYFEEQKRRNEKENKSRKFISELREKPREELAGIITRYSYYEPEKLEAAMIVAVERGIISYDLKESLQTQINDNMKRHWDRKARFPWEKNNAFVDFVSGYNDDEIYDIIDNPKDMVIDVYHAVILTALNRELISNDDFDEFFKGAKSALTTDFERGIDDFRERYDLPEVDDDPFNDEAVEKEAAKYRKCPGCGELVGTEFSECWNCQAEIPETAPIPDIKEMRKEIVLENKGFAIHPLLLVAGMTLFIFGASVLRDWMRHGDPFYHKYSLAVFGVFLIGLFLWFLNKYFKIMKD
jgi:hypothetical protein